MASKIKPIYATPKFSEICGFVVQHALQTNLHQIYSKLYNLHNLYKKLQIAVMELGPNFADRY